MTIYKVDVDTNNPSGDGSAFFSTREKADAYAESLRHMYPAHATTIYVSAAELDTGMIEH